MKPEGSVATWLEMVVAPHEHDRRVKLTVHAVEATGQSRTQGDETCYVISADGRWLCSSDGRLTVLRGLRSVERFIQLIGHDAYDKGDEAQFTIDCGTSAHCLAIGDDKTLRACRPDAQG